MSKTLTEILEWKDNIVALFKDIDLTASYYYRIEVHAKNYSETLRDKCFYTDLSKDEILNEVETSVYAYKRMTQNGNAILEQTPFRVLYSHLFDEGITAFFSSNIIHDVILDEDVVIQITMSIRLNR